MRLNTLGFVLLAKINMNCDICGAGAHLIRNEFEFEPSYSSFSFYMCSGCGHIKLLPPLSDSSGGQAYIRSHTTAPERIAPNIMARARDAVSPLVPRSEPLVYDIGSGNCSYAMAFSELGCRGVAVDVERFNPAYPLFVKAGELEPYLARHGAAGFFSNHSFEHIELRDLTPLLEGVKPYIAAGAFGYFVVPAAKTGLINSRIYLEEFVYGHKNLFSQPSAEIYFKSIFSESAGFSVSVTMAKSRMAFLMTRLRLLVKLITKRHLSRAVRLGGYLLLNASGGTPEELIVKIGRTKAA